MTKAPGRFGDFFQARVEDLYTSVEAVAQHFSVQRPTIDRWISLNFIPLDKRDAMCRILKIHIESDTPSGTEVTRLRELKIKSVGGTEIAGTFTLDGWRKASNNRKKVAVGGISTSALPVASSITPDERLFVTMKFVILRKNLSGHSYLKIIESALVGRLPVHQHLSIAKDETQESVAVKIQFTIACSDKWTVVDTVGEAFEEAKSVIKAEPNSRSTFDTEQYIEETTLGNYGSTAGFDLHRSMKRLFSEAQSMSLTDASILSSLIEINLADQNIIAFG